MKRKATAAFLTAAMLAAGCAGDSTTPNVLVKDTDRSCTMAVAPGDNTYTCQGVDFAVHFPAECVSESCGMILDLHAHGYDAEGHDADSRMRDLGGERGYVVVQPTASQSVLDAPYWLPPDDVPVMNFVERASAVWNLDPRRIHVTGHDVGGWMAWRLVCDQPNAFASAAILGAGAPSCPEFINPIGCDFQGRDGAAQLDLLIVHGMHDSLVDLECGQTQVDAVVDAWDLAVSSQEGHDGAYAQTRYVNEAGTTLEFVVHEYRTPYASEHIGPYDGHCVPGGQGELGCHDDGVLDWGASAVDFFAVHPR